jgi:hypothetical protein
VWVELDLKNRMRQILGGEQKSIGAPSFTMTFE